MDEMNSLLNRFLKIKSCEEFTNIKLKLPCNEISIIDTCHFNLVYSGSYARKEASEESDFDYFLLFPGGAHEQEKKLVKNAIQKVVEEIVGRLPSKNGAFNECVECGELNKNIGGRKDTNENITRRILFLTEGAALGKSDLFEKQKDDLIGRYIQDNITDHQLALFFLNDVIRYYRTICVDFENRTVENNKKWGIRNIKLVFLESCFILVKYLLRRRRRNEQ